MFDGACNNEGNFGAMRTILYNGLIFQTERVHKKIVNEIQSKYKEDVS